MDVEDILDQQLSDLDVLEVVDMPVKTDELLFMRTVEPQQVFYQFVLLVPVGLQQVLALVVVGVLQYLLDLDPSPLLVLVFGLS
jgi:hypothetical protein